MDGNVSNPASGIQSQEEPAMSFFQRLGNIFFEPGKTFEDIGRKPTWLGIFVIMGVLASAAMYTVVTRMDYETMIRKSLQMNPVTRNFSEEQIKQILSRPPSAFQRYSGIIFAPVGPLIGALIGGGIFLLAFVLMGVSIPFKKMFSVTFWAMAPPDIIMTVLAIISMYVKDPDTLEMVPAYNVVSNLGPLVAEKAHPALNSLLGSIDIFSIWKILLLSIGFAAVSSRRLTTKKAATVVLVFWGVWVLGKAGYFALMG